MEGENVIRLVPENDDEVWQNVVIVNFNCDNRQVNVNANDRSNDNSDYSVPVLPGLPITIPPLAGGIAFVRANSSTHRASVRLYAVVIPSADTWNWICIGNPWTDGRAVSTRRVSHWLFAERRFFRWDSRYTLPPWSVRESQARTGSTWHRGHGVEFLEISPALRSNMHTHHKAHGRWGHRRDHATATSVGWIRAGGG